MSAPLPPALRKARGAVALIFWTNGTLIASWVARIPAIKDRLALDEAQLGLALFAIAVGALLAFPITGVLVTRFGSTRVTLVTGLILCLALPLIALAPSILWLSLALGLFGASHGSMDIAMNAHAAEVETRYNRSIMSSFHGLWSLGGLTGAGLGAILASQHVPPLAHFVGVSLVFAALTVWVIRYFLHDEDSERSHEPSFARPNRAIFGLGVIAFCAFVIEGAIADWSGVYLRDTLGTGSAFAAAGYAAFSLTMMIARLTGDTLITRFGASRMLLGGGLTATGGVILSLLTPNPWLTLICFAATGLGMASVVPITFSLAARDGSLPPSTGIAAVATMGYGGYLVGPPVIGFLASWWSLRVALVVLVLLGLTIVALSRRSTAMAVAPSHD